MAKKNATTEEQTTNADGTAPAAPAPKVVKHLDVRIEELREDIAKSEAKLARLLIEQKNRAVVEGLTVGATIKFEFGRGEKRRELTGVITGVKDDEKQGKLLAVLSGEGFDAETFKIRAGDVLIDGVASDPDAAVDDGTNLEGVN